MNEKAAVPEKKGMPTAFLCIAFREKCALIAEFRIVDLFAAHVVLFVLHVDGDAVVDGEAGGVVFLEAVAVVAHHVDGCGFAVDCADDA